MIAAALAIAVAVAALLAVTSPLLFPRAAAAAGPSAPEVDGVRAIDVLREIEFDRATGKLSDADYLALRTTYTPRALAELRATSTSPSACARCAASVTDPAARFCSQCGLPFAEV